MGALLPQMRELLVHVRQLSLLARADTTARARARRAKRLLNVWQPFCPQICKTLTAAKPLSRMHPVASVTVICKACAMPVLA